MDGQEETGIRDKPLLAGVDPATRVPEISPTPKKPWLSSSSSLVTARVGAEGTCYKSHP